MLEIKLLELFAVCLGTVLITGFCAIKADDAPRNVALICFLLTADTDRLEYTVRSTVYPIAGSFPEAELLVLDAGASAEARRIFERLMERSCSYIIVE